MVFRMRTCKARTKETPASCWSSTSLQVRALLNTVNKPWDLFEAPPPPFLKKNVAHIYFQLAAIFALDLVCGDIRLCVETRQSWELGAIRSHWPTETDRLVGSLRFSGNTEHRLKVGELLDSFHYFPTASELLHSWSSFHRDPYLSPASAGVKGFQKRK